MLDESAANPEQNAGEKPAEDEEKQESIPEAQPETPPAEEEATASPTPAPAAVPAKDAAKPRPVVYYATGRRKSSIARVRMMEGPGKITVNGKLMHQYLPLARYQRDILAPLRATKCMGRYDVVANTYGGGMTGQTGAIVLGIARAILIAEPKQKETLQGGGWLTRDARKVERKKYGFRKARRSTQYSKR